MTELLENVIMLAVAGIGLGIYVELKSIAYSLKVANLKRK